MKINSPNQPNYNFRGAEISLSAASDMHGQLSRMGDFCAKIEENKEDLFLKEGRGKKNIFAIPGDWFMAGNVKGYKSNPDFNSQKYQLIFFNRFVMFLHSLADRMPVIFSPGNHEFDAGEEEFTKTIKGIHAKTVMTNTNLNDSASIKELVDKKKIAKSQVIKVQDDKDPNLYHKVLFISSLPGNMSYYNKKIKGIDFSDNVYKPQSELNEDDVRNSIEAIREEIEQFKSENPKGAVILMDHFAGKFQKELLKEKLPINVILSAHEHHDEDTIINSTLIAKLSQNFSKLENIRIKFDDDGNIEELKSKSCYSEKNTQNNSIHNFYEKIFKKDLEEKYTIPSKDNVKLDLKGLRYENSYLANYITDVIAHEIKEKYPKTDIFVLNASAIRGPLVTQKEGQIDNTHLLMTLNGIKKEDADIMISKVTGRELMEIICDNISFNELNHNKNPLQHYSALVIHKNDILNSLKHGVKPEMLCNMVRTTDDDKPLNPDKIYNLANVEKFFIKGKNPIIKEIYNDTNRTYKTDINAREAFQNYFAKGSQDITAKKEIRYF